MRQLPDEIAQLVRQLNDCRESKSWFASGKHNATICAILKQLTHEAGPEVLPYVMRCLLVSDEDVRQATRRSIFILAGKSRSRDLSSLNSIFLEDFYWHPQDKWHQLEPTVVRKLAGPADKLEYPHVLGMLSLHRSGYVRQEATRLLSEYHGGEELRYLNARLNDWVDVIAETAAQAVSTRIVVNNYEWLLKSLPSFLQLIKQNRRDHSEFVTRVVATLLDGTNASDIAAASRLRLLMKPAFVHAGMKLSPDRRSKLVRLGISATSPTVRLSCCRFLAEQFQGDELRDELVKVLYDPFMPVRREAYRIHTTHFPETSAEQWNAGLFDKARSIREEARYWLTKQGVANIAERYRHRLRENPTQREAIQGLAETGEAADIDTFRAWTQSSYPSHRAAGIEGLRRVLEAESLPEVLPLLNDPSPRVVKAAAFALAKHGETLSDSEILSLAIHAKSEYACGAAMKQIASLGKWRGLLLLLQRADRTEGRMYHRAIDAISSLLTSNTCFVSPTPEIRMALYQVLDHATQLPQALRNQVRSELDRFS